MGCVISQINCKPTLPSRQFMSHFMSHELVRDSYTFILHGPMHLHTYVHASIVKCMDHELTREALTDS